jgi:predicted alpha/beta superfamily hydrolase
MRHLLLAFALVGCSASHPGGTPAPSDGKADGAGGAATVIVHYPAGFGHNVTLRGDGGGLSWSDGRALAWHDEDAWTTTLALTRAATIKPLIDDETWALGPNWSVRPGQTIDLWPRFFTEQGRLDRIDDWDAPHLGGTRGITVYLPPSYDENGLVRLPVVYMHDGQNLFSDDDAFGGISWDVAGALDNGAADATIHEAIVVAVDNSDNRTSEYTPVADPDDGGGGADDYLAFLVEDLKPGIDARYRTLPDRAHTAIVGSSLGGLFSVYAGAARADVFGLVGALSPSTWWDNDYILGRLQGSRAPVRAYVDSGDSGDSNDDKDDTAKLADVYRSLGGQVRYLVQPGGEHSEYYWRQRLPGALGFLLGSR